MSAPVWPQALWLVRHAESEGNVADARAHENSSSVIELDVRDPDVELSATGRRQAAALGRWLATEPEQTRPSVALTSPYVRAASTAELAIAGSGLPIELHRDERLRERDLGVLDGLTGRGIRERYPGEAERRDRLGKFYYRPPSGESWCDVALRVRSLAATMRDEHADARVLVFSHQAVIMVFRYVLEDLSEQALLDIDGREQIANCAVTCYARSVGDRLELRGFNDAGAVEQLDAPVTEEPDAAHAAS